MLTNPKQGLIFREFHGHLMNIPKEYDNEAECLTMHPDILSKNSSTNTLLQTDKVVLKKSFPVTLRIKQVPYTPNVSFWQKGAVKKTRTKLKTVSQRLKKQASPTPVHCGSMVCDHDRLSVSIKLSPRTLIKSTKVSLKLKSALVTTCISWSYKNSE